MTDTGSCGTLSICKHMWDRDTTDPINLKVTEEMWDRLQEIYPCAKKHISYQTQVCDLFTKYLTNAELFDLDSKIRNHDYSGPYLWVLMYDYGGFIHLNKVARHVESILQIFDNPMVKKYCEEHDLGRGILENHDRSKTEVVEIAAYTLKYVHEACEYNDPRFQIGLEHHYKRNGHHPQYFMDRTNRIAEKYFLNQIGAGDYFDVDGDNMHEWSLIESILNMAGYHYERDLDSDPNALLFDVFDIPWEFITHYSYDDIKRIEYHLSNFRSMEGTVGRVCDAV